MGIEKQNSLLCSQANGQGAGHRESHLDSGRDRTLFLTSLLIELIDYLPNALAGLPSFLWATFRREISQVVMPFFGHKKAHDNEIPFSPLPIAQKDA
jgi:hypothetical protein